MSRISVARRFSVLCIFGLFISLPPHGNSANDDITSAPQKNGTQSDSESDDNVQENVQSCKVPGDEAIKEAKRRGFQFLIEPNEIRHGSCHDKLDSATVVVAAKEEAERMTCKITYFRDKELKLGWLLRDVLFKHDFKYLEAPAYHTRSPTFKVEFSAAGGDVKQLRLAEIELVADIKLAGDNCENWRDAFTHSAD